MKNEATLNENNQVVIGDKKVPAKTKISLRASSGQGMEKITAKDQKLPILKLLHSEVMSAKLSELSSVFSLSASFRKSIRPPFIFIFYKINQVKSNEKFYMLNTYD